ncbi:alpha/beta hydrolase [Georgenia thermotolerans]|uniref:Alpha/beta hydrolase fold domain-containing protein n=1 Tax=Georgenia thermotolerans TaxID=527326 RepID=A0A7J5UTZ4_9MICO|nr:alpha/beta hydrolase [Georgenia thermotolerans]KAE8765756.1 alpha/beta hydrolase fold domain-containing protein [Georgenia thermotolerans]
MTLHPEIAKIVATLPPPPPGPIDPAVLRAAEEAQVPPPAERLPLHAVEGRAAVTPAGEVPVRIYTPTAAESSGLLVYFHGGAFFLGSLDTHDHVARALAKETGLRVVSVGYRRAPEAAFPAGLEDCYGVVRWAAENDDTLGWDGTTLALAGDSSGGTFVAAVAAMAHDDGFDRITHQVLFYPSLDLDFDVDRYASLRENAAGYGLETAGLKPFNAFYLDSGADPADPRVSPIKREDLAGLPPALILTAEHDPLRDEGELYGRRLQEAGVEATVHRYAGANHGFVQNFSWIPEYYEAFAETGRFLRRR